MLCKDLGLIFGFVCKINLLGGCWSEPFQSVAHLEEGTMPGKVSAAIMSFGILYSSVA